jgi:hypothetical protein
MVCKYIGTFILVMMVSEVNAQLRIPSFEVALKGGYLRIDDDRQNQSQQDEYVYEGAFVQGELMVHIGQHLAVGYFYQRSIFANYHSRENLSVNLDQDAEHLIHGINLRLSTGRAAKFRPYLSAKYFQNQFVVNFESYNIATEGTGASAGFGLMMRMGHNLYINILEVEASTILQDNEVIFVQNNVFPVVRTGVTYNFSKRK